MAETVYSFSNHQFLASPSIDAFYVIETNAASILPVIVAMYRLDDTDKPGLSFELAEAEDRSVGLRITEGNIFEGDIEFEMLFAGRVLVETASRRDGNTLVRLNAFFNGAMIDNANRTLTVAGIGITDILATDPLNVALVNAPLTTVPYYADETSPPVDRVVKGLFLAYQPLAFSNLTGGTIGSVLEVRMAVEVLINPSEQMTG